MSDDIFMLGVGAVVGATLGFLGFMLIAAPDIERQFMQQCELVAETPAEKHVCDMVKATIDY